MRGEVQPYVGARPFHAEDRRVFFGRDQETRDLVGLLISSRAVLLHSKSGIGKTSLLNAGLIPQLEEEGFQILPITRVYQPNVTMPPDGDIRNIFVFNALTGFSPSTATASSLLVLLFKNICRCTQEPGTSREIMFR